jgi:hypothetical protein
LSTGRQAGGGNVRAVLHLLLSRRWLGRHALLLVAVAGFLALGRWQWARADAGNARSFGYAFEWPLFALCAVFWWGRTLRLELHPPAELPPVTGAGVPDSTGMRDSIGMPDSTGTDSAGLGEEDQQLAEYNRYLAWLHEQDQRSSR